MNNATPLTAAQILDDLRPMASPHVGGGGSNPTTITTPSIAASVVDVLPAAPAGSMLKRHRFNREVRKVLESYSPVVIEHTVRVLVARELDRIDAVADQHSLHVLVRKGQHGQQVIAAGQRLDEKLMDIEECGQDRWSDALARRIIALASQKAEGILTEEAFRQAADFAVMRYDEMRRRLSARVDGIRQVTDALVDFGRGQPAHGIKSQGSAP